MGIIISYPSHIYIQYSNQGRMSLHLLLHHLDRWYNQTILQKRTFRNEGIISTTDFTKLNFSPFHADFKNVSLDQIQKSENKMRGWLKPDLTEIIWIRLFFWKILTMPEVLEKRPGITVLKHF